MSQWHATHSVVFQTQEKLLESEKHRKQLIEELQNVKQVCFVGECRDGGLHGVQHMRISMYSLCVKESEVYTFKAVTLYHILEFVTADVIGENFRALKNEHLEIVSTGILL